MPKYMVNFNTDWPNADYLTEIEDVYDNPVAALGYLLILCQEHYPDQWRLNGSTFDTLQVVHKVDGVGDLILGNVSRKDTRREQIVAERKRLEEVSMNAIRRRDELFAELDALPKDDRVDESSMIIE